MSKKKEGKRYTARNNPFHAVEERRMYQRWYWFNVVKIGGKGKSEEEIRAEAG